MADPIVQTPPDTSTPQSPIYTMRSQDGSYRYYNPNDNSYTFTSNAPTQQQLTESAAAVTYQSGPDPATGLYVYTNNNTGKNVVSGKPINGTSSDVAKETTAPQSIASDSSLPSAATKQAENSDKQASNGTGASFTKSDGTTNNKTGAVTVKNATTGVNVGTAGTTTTMTQSGSSTGITNPPKSTNDRKVIITGVPGTGGANNTVIFDAMPQIQEQHAANYESFTPIQHPGEILKYKGTTARSWNITAHFISRTSAEASRNLDMLNLIRSWLMPYYGQGTATNPQLKKYLGAPPPILTLTAYGPKMVGPAKCVLESYGTDFPNDVDYIPCNDGTPFPVIMNITLTMKESWSPAEYSGFDLQSYRMGNLQGAFTKRHPILPGSNQTPQALAFKPGVGNTTEPVNITQAQVNNAVPYASIAATSGYQANTNLLNTDLAKAFNLPGPTPPVSDGSTIDHDANTFNGT